MSAAFVKSTLRVVSIVFALFGVFLLIYVGRVIAGFSHDTFSALHPFLAFYGGYLVYLALSFQRRFSSSYVHEFLSAIFCPFGLLVMVMLMESGFGTAWIRASLAIVTFLVLGVGYKVLLGYLGRALFGKRIVE